MRIDNTRAAAWIQSATQAPARRKPEGQDQLRLSGLTRLAADPAKIERLASAVRAGTYRVPAMHIAAGIISEMLAS